MSVVGFVGLGNMGAALAANLVAAGHAVVATDVAGPERNVAGAEFVADAATVAARADVVVFSLPDGKVSEIVARQLVAAPARRCDAGAGSVRPARGVAQHGRKLRPVLLRNPDPRR